MRQAIDQQRHAGADPEQERQFERCKQTILAEIDSWPKTSSWNCVKVEAYGHRDRQNPGNFGIKVEPCRLEELNPPMTSEGKTPTGEKGAAGTAGAGTNTGTETVPELAGGTTALPVATETVNAGSETKALEGETIPVESETK